MHTALDDMESYVQTEFEQERGREWWKRSSVLRLMNYVPLRMVDRDFKKWRRSQVSPRGVCVVEPGWT